MGKKLTKKQQQVWDILSTPYIPRPLSKTIDDMVEIVIKSMTEEIDRRALVDLNNDQYIDHLADKIKLELDEIITNSLTGKLK